MYIDKLDDTVNKYNNAYHISIKMKPTEVKTSTYIHFDVKSNERGPKFKVNVHVRISKLKKKMKLVKRSFYY